MWDVAELVLRGMMDLEPHGGDVVAGAGYALLERDAYRRREPEERVCFVVVERRNCVINLGEEIDCRAACEREAMQASRDGDNGVAVVVAGRHRDVLDKAYLDGTGVELVGVEPVLEEVDDDAEGLPAGFFELERGSPE